MSTGLSPFASQFVVGVMLFAFGAVTTWLVWLTLRHYNYARPAYFALFPSEHDSTDEGHLVHSQTRFDDLDEAHSELRVEVHELHDDVDGIKENQSLVITNQERIAEGIGIDIQDPTIWRGGSRGESGDD